MISKNREWGIGNREEDQELIKRRVRGLPAIAVRKALAKAGGTQRKPWTMGENDCHCELNPCEAISAKDLTQGA